MYLIINKYVHLITKYKCQPIGILLLLFVNGGQKHADLFRIFITISGRQKAFAKHHCKSHLCGVVRPEVPEPRQSPRLWRGAIDCSAEKTGEQFAASGRCGTPVYHRRIACRGEMAELVCEFFTICHLLVQNRLSQIAILLQLLGSRSLTFSVRMTVKYSFKNNAFQIWNWL